MSNTTLSNATLSNATVANPNIVRTFVAFQIIGGQIGLSLVVLVILFRSQYVTRHVTFLNFCLTWIISATCYLLLTYGGGQMGPSPKFGLCLAQASLLYGSPPMTGAASAFLVIQMWLSTRFKPGQTPGLWSKIRGHLFIGVPYFLFFVITIGTAVFGARHPLLVQRNSNSLYCSIKSPAVSAIAPILAALFTIIAVGFEVAIILHLFRDWRGFRSSPSGVSMNFLVRIGIFTFIAVLGVIVAFVFLAHLESPLPNLFLSLLPLAAFLVFGTQSDIINAMCFWRKDDDDDDDDDGPMVRAPSRGSSHDDVVHAKKAEALSNVNLE